MFHVKHHFCIIMYMKNTRFSIISIFAAVIIILQILSTYINFGGFPITLTLIPIIVIGAIYGPTYSSALGLVFGVVVSIMVLVGLDPNGAMMFAKHPIITIITCLLKGMLCGYVGAIVYKNIQNKKTAIILDAAITPITNTLILYLSLIIFFDSSFSTMVGAFISINFIIELLTNILIAPGLLGLIRRIESRNK